MPIVKIKLIFLTVIAAAALSAPASFARAQTTPTSIAPHSVLYVTSSAKSLASLRAHVNAMDIVAPQTYAGTPDGRLLGKPDDQILKLSYDAGAMVMPLIVNQNFSQLGMHAFLQDGPAQDRLLKAMVDEAKARGYIGFQYDFEHMMASDRDLYSVFVAKSAPVFHAAGLQLSVAVAPLHTDDITKYGPGSYGNWTGAFDYRALGISADFVSIMAYDDSLSEGPVASLPWVKQVLDYALARIPASKISLGVPFYAWVWRDKTGEREDIRGYPAIATLLTLGKKQIVAKGFSTKLGVPYVTYLKSNKKYTAWYENQKSFDQKVALVSQYKLFGFSAWALGLEDPAVWKSVATLQAAPSTLAER